MWVNLRHIGQLLINIMPQDNILQPKIYGGPHRQMANNHTIGLPPMLMQNDHIRQVLIPAQID